MFLTNDELRELTGYRVKPKQIRWLQGKRIPYTINAKGRIIVRRDYDQGRQHNDFQLGAVS